MVLKSKASQLAKMAFKCQSRSMSGVGHQLYGMYGSPYTRKVEAAMRYARIPFTKHALSAGNFNGDWDAHGFGEIKPKVIPVVKYPDGVAQNDSTYILQTLDLANHTRPLVPTNAGDRAASGLARMAFQCQSRSMSSARHQLFGGYGSPYTRKVEAAMRYARIPFTQHPLMPGDLNGDWESLGFGEIRPKVIPVVKYPNGFAHNDSTYILQKLDLDNEERPLAPTNDGDRFISLLLEDMFDEWGTKIMFGMRWLEELDQEWSGAWILYDFMLGQGKSLENVKATGKMFGSRQVSRMKIVGCQDPALVMRSLREIFSILEAYLHTGQMFLLGRPTVADFALYGQASQLVVDRTPDQIMRSEFPASWAWVRAMEDQSGHEGKDTEVSEGAKNMLGFAAQVYLPFLAANQAALAAGEKEVRVGLWGGEVDHIQPAFKYQEKCYRVLKAAFNDLPEGEKQRCADLLKQTGCLQYFE